MENMLRDNNVERLLKENEELHKKLEKVNDKLVKSEEYKSFFLSLVTNEIINPFTSILGLSKIITQLKDDEIEKARELAGMIYTEAYFLDFQLNNIFIAAHLEAGELNANPAKTDIVSLVENVITDLKIESDKRKIYLINKYDDDDSLKSFQIDPVILKTILLNLVNNAIKASKENGKVIIKTNVKENSLILEVQDFGKGIEKEKIDELFERFNRLDKTINSINTGSGIGLSVVKGLLDILHGQLEVESVPGEGSVFRVLIPGITSTECGFATDDDELFFDMGEDGESF